MKKLSEKRIEYCGELCKRFPDLNWGLIFGTIRNQDADAIKRLKKFTRTWNYDMALDHAIDEILGSFDDTHKPQIIPKSKQYDANNRGNGNGN